MAAIREKKINLQRAKLDFGRAKLNFARTKVTSGADHHANTAANLLAKGRRSRQNFPKTSNVSGEDRKLTFLEEGPIAEVASFLEPVQVRAGLEEWVRTLIPAEISETITYLIDPASEGSGGLQKLDIEIGENLEFTYKNLPSYNGEPCPALLQEYLRVIVALMEKFYQKQEGIDVSLRGRQIQLVLSCELITSPAEGISPPFTVQGNADDVVVCTTYVLSNGESPNLNLGFQDLGDDSKPDVQREIHQDVLTMWRNDFLAHRKESAGAGAAIFLNVGLVDPLSVFTN